MNILNEIKENGTNINTNAPTIKYKVFEDNSVTLEMVKVHKYRPRTKYLNVKLYHFRQYITNGDIIIKPIKTINQLTDYLTKPVNESKLMYLHKQVIVQ